MNTLKKSFWLISFIVYCALSVKSVYALDKNIENQYLLTLREGNAGGKIVVAKKVTQSFIENDEIFKEIERQLLENYNNGSSGSHADQMAWYCKAFGLVWKHSIPEFSTTGSKKREGSKITALR